MDKPVADPIDTLIGQLARLYLAPEAVTREALAQHIRGQGTLAIKLTTADNLTRALAIPFRKAGGPDDDRHWTRLCLVANALQADLGLPAPAVSINGASAYCLWLSLAEPVSAADAQAFLEALRDAYFAEIDVDPDAATAPVYLPPCLNPRTGKWAAFIHPGMGAAFADEAGLDIAPPLAGQAAFLEGLASIDRAQFDAARLRLRPARKEAGTPAQPAQAMPAQAAQSVPGSPAPADGLLLKDATLEDIVRHLHAKGIEPTFRFPK